MNTIINPERSIWNELLKRPTFSVAELTQKVQGILDEIKSDGIQAIQKYTEKFDGVFIRDITVSDDELNERYEKIAAGNPDMLNRIKEYYLSNTNAKNSIISEIKEDKALSLLIDSAIITEVDGSELTAA